MSFLRRNKNKDSEAPAPPPAAPPPAPAPAQESASAKPKEESKGNIFQRARNYIIESYNGLYKIFLSGYMPSRQTFMLIIVGLLIGLFWAYVLAPTSYYDAAPNQLSQPARDDWIRMVAGSYAANMYSDDSIRSLLARVDDPAGNIARLAQQAPDGKLEKSYLQEIQGIAQGVEGTPAPTPPGFISSLLTGLIIPILLILIILPILNLAWKVLIYQYVAFPIIDFVKMRTDADYREEKAKRQAELAAARERRRLQEEMVVEADEELGEPIMQRLSIYEAGRNYDDSFEIESAPAPGADAGDFLGECGASIAAKNDAGDPKALEVWLFEMANPTENLTKLLVTPDAVNDPILQGRVKNPATDLIPAQPGAVVKLEGSGLILQAKVADVGFSDDNAGITKAQLQFATFQTGGGAGAASPGYPPMPQPTASPTPIQQPASQQPLQPLQPPPLQQPMQQSPQPLEPPPLQQPAQQPPPQQQPLQPPPLQQPAQQSPPQQQPLQPPPLQPLQPPPLQMPDDDDDDDPFGGTGDFTPLGNN